MRAPDGGSSPTFLRWHPPTRAILIPVADLAEVLVILNADESIIPKVAASRSAGAKSASPAAPKLTSTVGLTVNPQELDRCWRILGLVGVREAMYPGGSPIDGVNVCRRAIASLSCWSKGLDEADVEVCIDVNALEPGDEWAAVLPKHIGDADVFYLMWSDSAVGSKWVDMGTREAIRRYDASHERRPRIKPIALRQSYPSPLHHPQRFHFYSVWVAHRIAQAALVRQDAGSGSVS